MTRKALIAGNWKMNGSCEMAKELAQGIITGASNSSADVLVCPPYPYLSLVAEVLAGSSVCLGAQNVSERANGAFTGEVSAAMLKELNCEYIIVGHSERREFYGEDSSLVVEKACVVAAAGMRPIVCVGETLEQREAGNTEKVIAEQLAPLFRNPASTYGEVVIAYEPVWAIGTGKTASPEQAQQVHAYIRASLADWDANEAARLRILYGGSVKPDNAVELFSMADVDGGLVGGAALQAESFAAICNAV